MTTHLPFHRPLHHVAVAVHSIAESARLFEILSGDSCSTPEVHEAHGVRLAFVGPIELLEPLGSETALGRFLEDRGQSMHHVAYRSQDIEADIARLEVAGVPLIDRVPRAGARGHRIAFVHPSATGGILVELVEETG